jgi:hypothetical protein
MPRKYKHPYALSRYGHHFSSVAYTGRPVRIKTRTQWAHLGDSLSPGFFKALLFVVAYAAALAAVVIDVTIWRP